jgi:branched-chain amino acid transport system ATP-binding protein
VDHTSLEVSNLTVNYGAVTAVRNVTIRVPEGRTVTILGANGAGKSSVLRAAMGLTPSGGSVKFYGREINALSVHDRSALGIQLVPEGRRVFASLSVEANLLAGAYGHRGDRAGIAGDIERMVALFPILKERLAQRAGTLSGGEQQMLAVARGLMARPRVLMMDEPSMGLAPIIIEMLTDTLSAIRKTGVTILLVEQNARLALDISDYAYFLQVGEIVLEGASSVMREDPRIRKVYLGI